MSETWDDYTSSDTTPEVDALDSSAALTEADSTANFDAFDNVITGEGDVSSDLDSAASAQDWSDWNSASADDWSNSADSYTDAGVTALESGDTQSAQDDFDNASSYADQASNYEQTASASQDTADSYVQDPSDTAASYDDSYDGS